MVLLHERASCDVPQEPWSDADSGLVRVSDPAAIQSWTIEGRVDEMKWLNFEFERDPCVVPRFCEVPGNNKHLDADPESWRT